MNSIVLISIALSLKHFICDYPLQNSLMLGKFKPFPHFIIPLSLHALVHAFGTLLLLHSFNCMHLVYWVFIDFVTHFIIDRIKANKKWLGRWSPSETFFWWALGFDQLLHGIVYAFFLSALVSNI